MFKKSLIVSVIFHSLLFAGMGLVSSCPRQHRAAQEHSPLVMTILDSGFSSETPVLLKKRVAGGDGQKKTANLSEQPLLKEHRERTEDLKAAEETPSTVLTDSEKIKMEALQTEPSRHEAGAEDFSDYETSGLTEKEIISFNGSQSSPDTVGQPDRLPVKIYAPDPSYPSKARKNNWEGVVILKILIQADGLIGEVTILQTSGYELLDQTAVKTVKRWRYRPAFKNRIAIARQVRVRVKFVLE